jgi:hypothetical protein
MSISIEFKNSSEIQAFPTRLSDQMQEVFVQTADAIILESVGAAKEQVRSESRKPRSRSGRYLQSIHSETIKTRFQVIGQVASFHPQAAIIEFGSRPHVIQAKENNTLFWPGASFPVKQVNHPGTPAFKVLGNAVEAGLENAARIFPQKIIEKFST